MRIVSFDAFRSLGIPGIHYVKPDLFLQQFDLIKQADWVLFPEYWQVNALHYAANLKIFPSIASYHIGHDKIEQTRVLQLLSPQCIPETVILENSAENAEIIWDYFAGQFVAKLPRSSEGRGEFLIETRTQWRRYCENTSVLYAQELLPIDRDMRIVVIGNQIIGGYWRLQSQNGFHNNIAQGGTLDFSPLHPAALKTVQDIARALNINHGGFDVAMVGNQPYILEFNRLFGNHGLSEQGIKPAEYIYQYLLSEYQPEYTPPHQQPQAV